MKRLLEKPDRVLALVCLAQLVLWTAIPALVHSAPPLDVVEIALWGREWVWATFKHPAFPAWILEIGRVLTGSAHWPAYLFSQIAVVVPRGRTQRSNSAGDTRVLSTWTWVSMKPGTAIRPRPSISSTPS